MCVYACLKVCGPICMYECACSVCVCFGGVRGWQKVFFSIILHLIRGARISHLNSALAGSASFASQLALALPVFFPSKHWDLGQATTPT